MSNRYLNRQILLNNLEKYSKLFKDRNVKFIKQFQTPNFAFPANVDFSEIRNINHVWSVGDKYYKLAAKHYSDPSAWWIIALYNNKPTESDLKIGDIILIPTPLEVIMSYYNI